MTTDNFCFYLQNRLIKTSQTGGQWYSDSSPFSIPWYRPQGFNVEGAYVFLVAPNSSSSRALTSETRCKASSLCFRRRFFQVLKFWREKESDECRDFLPNDNREYTRRLGIYELTRAVMRVKFST
jgi:hypothetical protein